MADYSAAIARFIEWLDAAKADPAVLEPTAMTLATVDAEGKPGARTVLLKQVDEQGFVFYTNSRSRKGQHLAANARAALTFFWASLGRQVLIEGSVAPVTDSEADAYFASRPRISQIGAWASQQSEPLESREVFESRLADIEHRYEGADVPRPPHWTGYRVTPEMIEFWEARDGRLHHRERYFRGAEGHWQWTLLNP